MGRVDNRGMTSRRSTAPSVRLVLPPTDQDVGVFCVSTGAASVFYAVREIACAIGGRGFTVHRLGLGTLYHVRVGKPEECSCECLGYLRHGHCRHIFGLLTLVRDGSL